MPSVDQLGELQKLLGGAGDSALDPPKYWGQVKDPLMAEYFPLQQGSEEYRRVYDAINLTTGPQQLKIHSIERVQNISLWQSYCVKKSATIAREKDPVAAERKYVRNWSRAVWKSASELAASRHRADAATEKISRRWRGATEI